jgi:hypothetical protein
MRVQTTLAVGKDIQFNLPDAAVKLLLKRLMLIVEALIGFGILGLPELAFIGRDAGVITVVGSNDLNLIKLQRSVGGRLLCLH